MSQKDKESESVATVDVASFTDDQLDESNVKPVLFMELPIRNNMHLEM